MTGQQVVQPQSRAGQYAAGKALRETCPRDAHTVKAVVEEER